jgi:hypothetical protein
MKPLARALASAGGAGTLVLSIYGFYQLSRDIYSVAGLRVAAASVATLTLLILVPFAYHFARPQILREFRLSRAATDRICTKRRRTVQIDANHHATIREQQRFIFMKTPDPSELVDIYSVHPQSDFNGFQYNSLDAIAVKQTSVGKHRVAVQWRPKKLIEPFVEYDHTEDHSATMPYDQPIFYVELHCIFPTGTFTAVVQSPQLLQRVIAFRRPRWRQLGSATSFVEYALSRDNSQVGNLQYAADRHAATWTMITPETGVSYVALFFCDGGVELWQQQLAEERRIQRVWRRFKDRLMFVV